MNAKIFLIDGSGACASAVLLGVVLPAMQPWVGMPTPVLHLLAAIATLFAAVAFAGYRFAGDHASRWLRVLMVANLLYCLLTGSLVSWHWGELTAWGGAYFAAEIVVILGLVLAERQALRRVRWPGRLDSEPEPTNQRLDQEHRGEERREQADRGAE